MRNKWIAAPYVGWMAFFVVAPLIVVLIYAFTRESADGSWFITLDNFEGMMGYASVFGRSFLLAGIATLVCILLGYPMAYFLARERGRLRSMATLLIMLPMWMNFLLRTYAWMSILDDNGLINQFLSAIGFFDLWNAIFGTNLTYFHMINTQGAIVLGMVYNFLPFMVLPIFSVIVKIDSRVIEAAQDLGANSVQVFRRVIFPLSLPGVLSGVTMVLIPSVSTFVISRLLGGGKSLLLGDLIEMQFLGAAYNPHLGSAISLVMMVIVLVCMGVMNRFGEGEEEAVLL